MNVREALRIGIDIAEYCCMAYLEDLSDEDLMRRPAPGMNHINWQVGHLIASEYQMIEQARPGCSPPLPAGFAEKYSKETAAIDDPSSFHTKEELLAVYRKQREATLAALESIPEEDFAQETGIDYAPTVAALFSMQGSHWMMHSGQWVVVRRQMGKPPLF
ncbi:MAG: DinB family protein [Planctomycetaceae bacterium]|nr:DinB family protein [Planctomycetaceae bacterium]